jgi:hypothetical protein
MEMCHKNWLSTCIIQGSSPATLVRWQPLQEQENATTETIDVKRTLADFRNYIRLNVQSRFSPRGSARARERESRELLFQVSKELEVACELVAKHPPLTKNDSRNFESRSNPAVFQAIQSIQCHYAGELPRPGMGETTLGDFRRRGKAPAMEPQITTSKFSGL